MTSLALASKAVWGYERAQQERFVDELTVTAEFIKSNPVFVADDGGPDPLGMGALDPIDDQTVDLGFMFVAPAAMRGGIGRSLFAHLVAAARTRGFARMKIIADPNAVGFYERMGAVRTGSEESASVPGRKLPVLSLVL